MLTAGLDSLAMMRFSHGGGPGGFAWLLIGLAAIVIGIWAFAQNREDAPAKN